MKKFYGFVVVAVLAAVLLGACGSADGSGYTDGTGRFADDEEGPLTANFGPSTILNENTDALSFVRGAASTFTLTVRAAEFEEFVWYLDDTTATEGVDGNTYTPPNTLKVGTHFVIASAKLKENGMIYSQLVMFDVTKQ